MYEEDKSEKDGGWRSVGSRSVEEGGGRNNYQWLPALLGSHDVGWYRREVSVFLRLAKEFMAV